jgi:hypothetical protein
MRYIIIILAALFLCGCRTTRQIPTQTEELKKDSVRVEYRERTVFVPDTVYLEIPLQTAERTTADSVSHLENDYASSDARINLDGTLFHTLATKTQSKPVPTERRIEYRDSIVYRDKAVTRNNTVTEYVERSMTWWEQAQIYGFWAALILLAVVYRRKIFNAAIRLILGK